MFTPEFYSGDPRSSVDDSISTENGLYPHELFVDKLVLPNGLPGKRSQLCDLCGFHADCSVIIALGSSSKALKTFENIYPYACKLRKEDAVVATSLHTHMGLRPRGDVGLDAVSGSAQSPIPRPDHHVIIASLLLGFIALPGRRVDEFLKELLGDHENMMTPGDYSERILFAQKAVKPTALWQFCDVLDKIDAWKDLVIGWAGPIFQVHLEKGPTDPTSPCILRRFGLQIDRKRFEECAFVRGLAPSLAQGGAVIPVVMDIRVRLLSDDGFVYLNTPGPAVDPLTGEKRFLHAECWSLHRTFQTLAFLAKKRSEGCTEDEIIEVMKDFKPAGSSSVYFTRQEGKVGKTNGIQHFTEAELAAKKFERDEAFGEVFEDVSSDDVVSQVALVYSHNSKKACGELLNDRLGSKISDMSALGSITSTTMWNRVLSVEGHVQKCFSQVSLFFIQIFF